jgi:tetratricopeptide (TPR) repeat protein
MTDRAQKAQELYEYGYACYLKYGKDQIGGQPPNPQDLHRAIEYLADAVSHDPNHAQALVVLGLAHSISGNKGSALYFLERALLHPNELGKQEPEIRAMVQRMKAAKPRLP